MICAQQAVERPVLRQTWTPKLRPLAERFV